VSTATYIRFCGPAHALVRMHGASSQIRWGNCIRMPGEFLIRIGMFGTTTSAAPTEILGLFVHHPKATYAGTFSLQETAGSLVYAQIPRQHLAIDGGTITVGQSKRAGLFRFRLTNGTRATGSWSCG
jgi:hypothetical protein